MPKKSTYIMIGASAIFVLALQFTGEPKTGNANISTMTGIDMPVNVSVIPPEITGIASPVFVVKYPPVRDGLPVLLNFKLRRDAPHVEVIRIVKHDVAPFKRCVIQA